MLRKQGIKTNLCIVVGMGSVFAAYVVEEQMLAATGVLIVLTGIDIWTTRRISELEEQIAQLKLQIQQLL